MDFITRLPKNGKQHESVIVVLDKLINETHFSLVKYTYKDINIVDIFMKEIFRLHGVPKIIILDRDAKLWEIFGRPYLKDYVYN